MHARRKVPAQLVSGNSSLKRGVRTAPRAGLGYLGGGLVFHCVESALPQHRNARPQEAQQAREAPSRISRPEPPAPPMEYERDTRHATSGQSNCRRFPAFSGSLDQITTAGKDGSVIWGAPRAQADVCGLGWPENVWACGCEVVPHMCAERPHPAVTPARHGTPAYCWATCCGATYAGRVRKEFGGAQECPPARLPCRSMTRVRAPLWLGLGVFL